MAEALLGIVIQNLQSFGQDQLATFWGVHQQTQKLSSNLTAIRAVLRDAERKQITSHAVKDWLQKLTDAAYVLDDILDECSIHSTKVNFDDRHTSCLSRLHPKDILFRFNIGKRMKDITQRFHDIHEERSMFNLVPGVTEVQTILDNWRQTSSDITEPIVYGRDQDREQIVKFLLEDVSDSEELSIYPIVGMGGLGKTTLAKQVFNDNRVCKHFDLTIWVCVSDDFNTEVILQSIIECITGQNPNLNSLESMRKKVEEVLHGSRYLLVLDDVWNEDQEKWKQLKGKLQCARAAKGAFILVTTRLKEVASSMQTHPAYHLKELSGEDSWSLFKHHAFGPNREEMEELVSIGKEIVRKCVGSPLAIKTLGSIIRDESDVKQWQNVKESEIWDIREETSSATGEENSIMRALKLSYFNLELSLRRCFSFCAIFPKDFEIDKEELIHLWMANGFIKCERNVEVEDVGNKVWKKLYSRSFFQEAKYDEFGMITTFKIHDLFHDLAQSIMGEECVVIVKGRLTPLPTRVHYSSLFNSGVSDDMTAFKQRTTTDLKKVESLQTFLDIGGIGPVPSNHCLRALQTSSSLVSPLKDLTLLRYLSLRFCRCSEESLNSSICQLPKLQILKLFHCQELHGLPKDLTRLQDLRHIVINCCHLIQETPPNIGKLRHLRTLNTFVVGLKGGCGLAELHSLKLGGTLSIRGLENVPNEWDAKQANLMSKKELNRLHLSWGSSANSEVLRDESDVKQWQNVKESEIWDIREESSSATGEENSIMRALKLSYFNLELSLRRCFSFCAIFPKDFEIDKEELIHLWMANGFIKCEGNVEVEDVGNKVWKKLYSRSFFQEAKYDEFGMITTFKIHDLFHDLAQSIMGEECVVIVKGRLTPLPTRVHYSSLFNSGVSDDMTAFKQRLTTDLKKVESLQTFLDIGGIGPVPSNHCLRALQTSSSLLSPLKDLTLLRYLSLRFCRCSEESLNSSICQLPKLQILKLFHCQELHGLPKDLTRLQDLRHIVINCCHLIQETPPNIGKLRHLRTLNTFVVGLKGGCGLAELHSLKLGGTLSIRGLENVPNEWDAKQANLMSKKELNRLHLSWGSSANSEGSNVSVERVLEALEPPSALKSFGMRGYQGRQLSNWMKSSVVLRDLVEVELLDCDNCEELPPLGKLAHLKRLEVSGMKNVKWIDGDTYDGVEEKAFPSLEKLTMSNLPNLERMLREGGVEMLPRLSELRIFCDSNLKFPRLSSVEKLVAMSIDEVASFMEGVLGNLPSLKTLGIYCIKGVVVLPDQLSGLHALQELRIEGWYDVEYFPEHVLEGLTSLRTLSIKNCKKLKSLSEGVRHLACLESLTIGNCPELVTLPSNMNQLTALRNVSIIQGYSTLPYGLQRVPSLRVLGIYACTCTSLPDWLGDMTTLEELRIHCCWELRSLPSSIQRLTNLSHLAIRECPHLKKRCKRETGEDWQYIKHIPKIQLYFWREPTFCDEFKSILFTSRNV
ncbi:putative disease resistance protein RGA3 [Vigna umbellata]|uniref:putative disease resistance protein RGA3 n=1 Tax=Vigna umbellata TaxID=87088 RepID=UPI001F5EF54C|nr:putative disease resistance protein RGA3 [Vigna umbellata]